MQKSITRTRRDGWTPARRSDFLGALRASGKVVDACLWAGMSVAGAYALAKRDPAFAAAWDAALAARTGDRPVAVADIMTLSTAELMRRLRSDRRSESWASRNKISARRHPSSTLAHDPPQRWRS